MSAEHSARYRVLVSQPTSLFVPTLAECSHSSLLLRCSSCWAMHTGSGRPHDTTLLRAPAQRI